MRLGVNLSFVRLPHDTIKKSRSEWTVATSTWRNWVLLRVIPTQTFRRVSMYFYPLRSDSRGAVSVVQSPAISVPVSLSEPFLQETVQLALACASGKLDHKISLRAADAVRLALRLEDRQSSLSDDGC
jgi:hypothetical protein